MTTRIEAMTRDQLAAALRTVQVERDRAVARANYWRERHADACAHLLDHRCAAQCAPCDHDTCAWDDCGCDCHLAQGFHE